MVKPSPLFHLYPKQSTPAPLNTLIPIESKTVIIGKDRDNAYYGWDNEYGKQKVDTTELKASQYLVSNKEYLEFVKDGGYTTQSFWTEEGWAWVQYTNATMPEFWVGDIHADKQLRYRAMTHEIMSHGLGQ